MPFGFIFQIELNQRVLPEMETRDRWISLKAASVKTAYGLSSPGGLPDVERTSLGSAEAGELLPSSV